MSSDNRTADENRSTALEDIVARFESAWLRGQAPVIENLLPPDGPLRLRVLPELLLIDLEDRLKAGLPARVEDYRQRFPELASNHAAIVELSVFAIKATYCLNNRRFVPPRFSNSTANRAA